MPQGRAEALRALPEGGVLAREAWWAGLQAQGRAAALQAQLEGGALAREPQEPVAQRRPDRWQSLAREPQEALQPPTRTRPQQQWHSPAHRGLQPTAHACPFVRVAPTGTPGASLQTVGGPRGGASCSAASTHAPIHAATLTLSV